MEKILRLIKEEERRQKEGITLIPSENYVSPEVSRALGSVLTSKYSEGYPGRRYYQGNSIVDEVENLAIEKAEKLFGVPYANVQPYSGSPANSAVLFALLNPGDKICGMKLSAGGHLTHGHPEITFSGKYFQSVQYDVDGSGKINYQELTKLVKKEKPKLIFAGTTSYPFKLDFEKFGKIADSVNAWLVADISHIAGLVISGLHPSPSRFAHIITTTTHKTLRGPRGAMILVTEKGLKKDSQLGQKIDKAVFPGLQGGPHDNVTAAIAVCLNEAAKRSFRSYSKQIVVNARTLKVELERLGIRVFGTENHLMNLDFSDFGGGAQMAYALEVAGIYVNKNNIPHDHNPPFYPSGIRIGTPAITTRGMGKEEMGKIAWWIFRVYEIVRDWRLPDKEDERKAFMEKFKIWAEGNKDLGLIRKEVVSLARKFPLFKGKN